MAKLKPYIGVLALLLTGLFFFTRSYGPYLPFSLPNGTILAILGVLLATVILGIVFFRGQVSLSKIGIVVGAVFIVWIIAVVTFLSD